MSCGYTEKAAVKEANSMIEQNRWDGAEMCSREYAIEMILEDLGCLYEYNIIINHTYSDHYRRYHSKLHYHASTGKRCNW